MAESSELSDGEQLSIRYNQILGLFDRSPLATGICYADGLVVRVANPAFAEAVGVPRDRLRGMTAFELVTPEDDAAVAELTEAIRRRTNARHEMRVRWTVSDLVQSGRISFELVDDALIGNMPLLTYLHVDRSAPARERVPELDPTSRTILEAIAAGETTAAIARSVGLTVDGVNYHVARLCRRLGATSRTAAVARAYVLGVLDAEAWPPRVANA